MEFQSQDNCILRTKFSSSAKVAAIIAPFVPVLELGKLTIRFSQETRLKVEIRFANKRIQRGVQVNDQSTVHRHIRSHISHATGERLLVKNAHLDPASSTA